MSKFKKTVARSSSLMAIAIAMTSTGAFAQGDQIIVTATKRATTLQETPVAVSVVSGDDLKDSQIREVRDLSLLAPSLEVVQQQTSSNTVFSVRGIGTSGNNAGLEPSVGVFVDGVYRSRQGASINDFPTVERIEILRGPQSTLYGRNTPAGVISIITKKPQYEYGADAEVTFANYSSVIFKGTLTGPISENLAFRISGNTNNRDGYITNVVNGQDVNDRNRWAVRGQLLFEPSDNVSIRLIGDYNRLQEACCAAPFFQYNPGVAGALPFVFPGAIIVPATPFERQVAFDGNLFTDQTTFGFSGQIDIDFGGATLTSITAYRDLEETSDIDADFLDLQASTINQGSGGYGTFTQELRLASTGDNRIDWMVGGFYFSQDLRVGGVSTFGPDLRPFADVILAGGAISTLEGILSAFPGGPAPGSFLGAGNGLQRETFNQEDENIALFATVDLHATDRLTVTGGIRWETETKDVVSDVLVTGPFLALDLTNVPQLAFVPPPFGPIPVGAFAGLQPFQFFTNPFVNFTSTRTDTKFSYLARVAYDVSDNLNIYGSYATGFKSGGFNLSRGSSVSTAAFDPESTRSFEVGAKGAFFEGAVTANLALFHQQVSDFQANIFNGSSFDLTNAGQTTIKGIEFDTVINPFDNLIITGGVTYLDGQYDSFVRGPCINSAFIDDTNIPAELITCSPTVAGAANPLFTNTRDFSGVALSLPKFSTSTTATLLIPMGNLESYVRGEVQHKSDVNLGGDQNPLKQRGAYTLLNASVGIGHPDVGWQVVGWIRNIADEEFAQGIFDSVAQPGGLNGYPNDPRTYGITLRLSR